ncbi:MAG: hypothetical protein J1F43_08565 [Muribaculaceae bacterium]|nr:hypothetical protein [Muribaculaceae bacterium]
MKKLLLSLFAVTAMGLSAYADDGTLVQQCLFGKNYNQTGISVYNSSFETKNNNFTWTVVNFNNNGTWTGMKDTATPWNYVRCGGKSSSGTASITTNTAISEEINTVVLDIEAVTAKHINSIKLLTSSTSDFTTPIETLTFATIAKGAQTVILQNPQANLFYQVLVDYNNTSTTNGILTVNSVSYYSGESGNGGTTDPDPEPEPGNQPPAADTTKPITFDLTQYTYGITGQNPGASNDSYLSIPATMTYGGVVITLNGYTTGNSYRFWTDGLRPYKACSPYFTVKAPEGQKVTYVTWTLKNNDISITEASASQSQTQWTGSEDEVTFNISFSGTKTSGTIISITVAYGDIPYEDIPEPTVPEYTVAGALAAAQAGTTGTVIVSGIVTKVTNFNSSYGSLSYYIGDTLDATETLYIYGGLGIEGAKFEGLGSILIGAKVQVKGTLKMYTPNNGDPYPEIDLNSVLLSYNDDDVTVIDPPQGVLTVADAVNDYINKGYTGTAIVTGIITEIAEISTQYGNATYTIKDSEDASVSLIIYRGKGFGGEAFTADDEIAVGGVVEVEGDLLNYNGTTPQIINSKIVSYKAPVGTSIDAIGTEVAPVEYYNLQGVKVHNPVKGQLYIIRQGKKAVKAIL